MRCLPTILVLAMTLVSVAEADEVVTEDGIIEGLAIAGVFQPLAGATVRIVGDAFVMTTHANARGAIRISGLPRGSYRIEVEHGAFSHRPRVVQATIRIDRGYVRCCGCAMNRRTVFADIAESTRATVEPPWIDTRSTTQGIRLRSPGW